MKIVNQMKRPKTNIVHNIFSNQHISDLNKYIDYLEQTLQDATTEFVQHESDLTKLKEIIKKSIRLAETYEEWTDSKSAINEILIELKQH